MSVFDVLFRLRAEGEDSIKRATNEARASFRGLSSDMRKVDRVGQALGGRFGELVGRARALEEAFGAGALKFGAAAVALGGVATAATAAARAVVDVTSAIVDINRNASEMLETLTHVEREALGGMEERSLKAEKALDAMDRAITMLQLRIGSEFAPKVELGAKAVDGLVTSLNAFTPSGSLAGATSVIGDIATALGGPLVQSLMHTISLTNLAALGLSQLAGEDAAIAGPAGPDFGFNGGGMLLPDAAVGVPAGIAAPAPSGPSPAEQRAAAQERARKAAEAEAEAQRKLAEALNAVNVTFTERLDVQGTVMQQEQIASAQEQANLEMTKQLRRESTMAMMEDASFAMGVIGESAAMVGDFVVEAIKRSGGESRRALKQAAVASKAFAIMDVALKTAQSIMSAAAIGFPQAIPGVVAATALGAVQIATVAATPLPSFHTGGRRGADEQMAPPAIIRRGEVPAIITEQGFRNIGGDRGLAAINRGDTGGGMQPIYLVLEGVTAPLRELARPEPALGQT